MVLLGSFEDPWLCFEDFNIILNVKDKVGGQSGSSSNSNYVNSLMFELGAIDLGFSGLDLLGAKSIGVMAVLGRDSIVPL